MIGYKWFLDYNLVNSGVECKSRDEKLGKFDSVWECAYACQERKECNYFVFGIDRKAGLCYREKTNNRECTEGWEVDLYDFYEMTGV